MNQMNRLQKKCVIGTVGIHLLLFLILIVGPAFFNPQPKVDNTQVLDMIPANLVDAAVNSGVRGAQLPQPTPVQPQPQPPPPQPQYSPPPPRIAQPPPPAPTPSPSPSLIKEFERYFASKPTPSVKPDMTPVERPVKHQDTDDNIKISLTKVKRTPQKNSSPDNAADARELNKELRTLKTSLSSSTKIDLPGNSSASEASYVSALQSVYDRALRPNVPEQAASGSEKTIVKVTIASDGTVISSEIISPSGDPAWDNAVQRTLNQVTYIAAFPEGATEKERSYNLGFSPDIERSLE
jgi:TonB family protein